MAHMPEPTRHCQKQSTTIYAIHAIRPSLTHPHLLAISSGDSTISLPPIVPVRPLTPKVRAYPGGSSEPAGGNSRRGHDEALDFWRTISTCAASVSIEDCLTFVERMRKVEVEGSMGP